MMNEDKFKELIRRIEEAPSLSDSQKKQLVRSLTDTDPELNEDEFLVQFPPDTRIFLLEHFPYPIPGYLRKAEEYK